MVGPRAGRVAFAWLALACVTLHSAGTWDVGREPGPVSHHEQAALGPDTELVPASSSAALKLPRLQATLLASSFLTAAGVGAFERVLVELHSPRAQLRFWALAPRAPPGRASALPVT